MLTCFPRREALQAQIDSIEAAAKERAQDMISANLLIASHDDKRKRRNRARKSVSNYASSDISQPDLDHTPIVDSGVARHRGAATRAGTNQASEPPVYTGFSEARRFWA